jgi:hypothetical protein
MKALLTCTVFAMVIGVGMFACNPNSIGRPCVNPNANQVSGSQFSSPALECPSRLCLIEPSSASSGNVQTNDGGAFRATCTASCQHDSDCDAETKDFCHEGFVCTVATTVGPFCCKKYCVCKGDLVVGTNVDQDGGTIDPPSCDPAITTCLNVKK